MGRSRSRSRSRRHRRRSTSSPSSRESSPDVYRVHVADLSTDPDKREIERKFGKYGRIIEVWIARNPPCFAFVVFKYKDDAETAIREMDGQVIAGSRIRCTFARPRKRGGRGSAGIDSRRCYRCGEPGHFSRECELIRQQRNRMRSYESSSRSRSRSRGRKSRSRDRKRRRSRSTSRRRRRRSNSRSKSRSRSRSHHKSSPTKSSHRKTSEMEDHTTPQAEEEEGT